MTQVGSTFCDNCWKFYKDFIEDNSDTEDAFKAILERKITSVESWVTTEKYQKMVVPIFPLFCEECFNPEVKFVTAENLPEILALTSPSVPMDLS
jgi:hypothetical protein